MTTNVINNPFHDIRGSLWHRWDLHFHTPTSYDYENKALTNQQIVDSLIKAHIRVVAITDHHKIELTRIQELQKLGQDRLTVLPGIELRDEHGGNPIHYICIFPENCDLPDLWTKLQGKLGLTPNDIATKGGDDRVYVPIKEAAELTRELKGVISIHAGAKSNSIEEIRNKEQFQQRLKYDITKEWVDLMEIGQLKDIDVHMKVIFPTTGLDKPLIICSDNHDSSKYDTKAPLWLRADPTFRGLLMVLREPHTRVFIGDRPDQVVHIEQNPTKYVRSVIFNRKQDTPASEKWFRGSVLFNPGLVAIIGNKGSGKSALADTLGLLGGTKNSNGFSFLCSKRFRHPLKGHAHHFEATLEWRSGEKVTRSLADQINPEEIERIKYLPQDHVERVCNEIVGTGEDAFEQELKSVIFSHVPDTQMLGFRTLDKLVEFRAGEKQKRIDSLFKELREASRSRASCESENDPAVRHRLVEQIRRREIELDSHDKSKPAEKPNPASSADSGDIKSLLQTLASEENEKRTIGAAIDNATTVIRNAERRLAVANRVIEKVNNFQKEFERFKSSLREDAQEIGLSVEDFVTFSSSLTPAQKVIMDTSKIIESTKKTLDDLEPPGLRKQLADIEAAVNALQLQLDAPNRAYQTYLKEAADWQQKRDNIVGTDRDPESLNGLKASLLGLDRLPAATEELKTKQIDLAIEIHSEKLGQVAVYRDLYGPVQSFINSHDLAKDKLQLEFRAELINENFARRLLSLLALNRKGSFMGIDEGNARVEALVQTTQWDDVGSMKDFLQKVDNALHQDQRERPPSKTQLREQLVKGTNPEEVFDLLYGLEYLRPKYILKWEGKELSMLSPGERGTLLLIFYLLIEKGDMPLIIDQPEGNLDNHTIAKVLIDCIRAAREKRQVFIVTHNPNLAVVCDADQIVYANMNKKEGNEITYTSGALENPTITGHVTDVLEGTLWAFEVRDGKYVIAELPKQMKS